MPVLCLGSHSISYKVFCRWLLFAGLGGVQVRVGCEPRLTVVSVLGQLTESFRVSWSQMWLIWDSLGKCAAWAKTIHSYGKATGNDLGGLKVGWGRASGTARIWQTVWSRLMESLICVHLPALWLCQVRAWKRNDGLCQHFCLGESCPPVLTLMPNNSVPPHMSLMSFNLLPLHSEGLNQNKSVHRPYKGTAWDSSSFCLSQPQSMLVL